MSKRLIIFLSALFVLMVIACTVLFIRSVRGLSIKGGTSVTSIFIPDGSDFNQVFDSLNSKVIIKHKGLFKWLSGTKKYTTSVKPGHYLITGEMSYINIINILRSGNQTPVKVTFNNVRTIFELAGKISHQIEADSASIVNFLTGESIFISDGFKKEDVICIFIPDTYEFYWNTGAQGFYSRMLKEYRKFWNAERLSMAKEKNLTPVQVSILASIVDDEVVRSDEKPRIAGVYLNRLRKGIPLQACPTIKFALNDFTITRVLNKHLQVESPYNTYKHKGFPPGPIGCPSIEGIEAVLKAEKHEYYFFAAKADFSGYHNFSKTLAEHNRNAALYQKELDKRKIFR